MKIKEKYLPCSNWLFYKIYVSKDFADEILLKISNFFFDIEGENQWFFIRYTDPNYHIRIRLNNSNKIDLGYLIGGINKIVNPYFNTDIVWKAEIGSYNRELDRYYGENIIESESIFHIDSEAIIRIIRIYLDENLQLPSRWIICIYLIEDYLKLFGYLDHEKIEILSKLANSFSSEYKIDKNFIKEFNKLYKKFENQTQNSNVSAEISKILKERYIKIEKLIPVIQERINNRQIDKDNLISSYIHMTANRIFDCNPRFQELVVYKFMYKYHLNEKKKKHN